MTSWNAGPPPDRPEPGNPSGQFPPMYQDRYPDNYSGHTYSPADYPYGGYPGDNAQSPLSSEGFRPPGYPSAPPVQMPGRSGPGQPASMGNRLLAKLIDGLIVGMPFAILYVWAADTHNSNAQNAISLASAVVTFVYETYFIATRGATIGKQVRGILVVDEQTGLLLTPGKAFIRSFAQFVSNYVFLAGCWSPLLDRTRRRGWHDKAAHDVVINSR